MTENELTFEQAIERMQEYLGATELLEKVSSVSITFTADWTGKPESYVIDMETQKPEPRLFSLETGHISKLFTLPSKLTKTALTKLTDQVSKEFIQAHNELVGGENE